MKTTFLFDFSKTILFTFDRQHKGSLNTLHESIKHKPEYNFLDHFYFNEPLLKFLEKHTSEVDAYIFTTGRIQEMPEVKNRINNLFHKIFTVADFGIPKTDPKVYEILAKLIGRNPNEIIFVDDYIQNIKTAQESGFQTILFNGDPKWLVSELSKKINLKHTT